MARKSRKQQVVTTDIASASVYNVAAYIRLSVEDNSKRGNSLESQKAILENYIALNHELKLHGFYIDNGISGTTFDRPQFQKMLSDVESGIINCIAVKDLSRLGRNAIDTGYYIEKHLPKYGCRFISVNDNFDTDNDMDTGAGFIMPLKNVINEAYALDIGGKIKAQQHEAMLAGEFVGARPPYGYRKAPGNCHKLVIDPVTAPVVARIFDLFLNGVSLNEIVLRLNAEEVPTPSHYCREIGMIKHDNLVGNGSWQTFTVSKILKPKLFKFK